MHARPVRVRRIADGPPSEWSIKTRSALGATARVALTLDDLATAAAEREYATMLAMFNTIGSGDDAADVCAKLGPDFARTELRARRCATLCWLASVENWAAVRCLVAHLDMARDVVYARDGAIFAAAAFLSPVHVAAHAFFCELAQWCQRRHVPIPGRVSVALGTTGKYDIGPRTGPMCVRVALPLPGVARGDDDGDHASQFVDPEQGHGLTMAGLDFIYCVGWGADGPLSAELSRLERNYLRTGVLSRE